MSNQIEIKQNIVYRWWTDEPDHKITYEQQDYLEFQADQTILEMRKSGYTSGEMEAVVDDILFRGWWEFNYE